MKSAQMNSHLSATFICLEIFFENSIIAGAKSIPTTRFSSSFGALDTVSAGAAADIQHDCTGKITAVLESQSITLIEPLAQYLVDQVHQSVLMRIKRIPLLWYTIKISFCHLLYH